VAENAADATDCNATAKNARGGDAIVKGKRKQPKRLSTGI
jgi:hypothetical protein